MALTLQLLADLSHNERFRSAMPDPSLWDINLDMEQHPYGWLSLVPPLVAILLAILTRRILISLLLAILSGALILTFYDAPQNLMESPPAFGGLVPGAVVDGWNVLVQGLADSWNDHLWPTLINPDKISVFVFTCLMGAIVGMVNRAAGMRGLLQLLSPVTGSVRRAQVTAWFSGMLVFFDDYANTMLLGTTFRSMFDRLKISREKLAYIVDSTAAPVAGLAIVSTWIAGELDYIKSGLGGASELNPFDLFLQSIPYRFYVLWALFFVVLLALTRRDFGPMLKAEVRARREGEQEDERGNAEFLLPTDMDWNRMELKPGDLDDRTIEALAVAHDSTLAPSGTRARSLNAILPILVTVVAILWFMFQSGVQDVGPLPTTPKTQASTLIEGVVIAQPVGNFSTANPPSLQTQDEATGDANESIPDGGADAATTDGGGNETTTAVAAGPTAWEVTQWLRDVFGASNSYTSLVWGSLVGFFFTLIWLSAQRIVPFVGLSQAAGRGAAHMVPALMVLWLASALSAMTSNDPTPAYAEELARAKTMAGAIAGIEQIRSFDDLSQLERVHETLHLNHLDRAAIIQALAPAYSDPELFMRNVTDRVNDIQPDGSFYARYLFQNGRQVDWNEAVKDAELPVANPKDEVPESSSAPKVTLPDLDPPPRPKQADDGSAEARPVLGGGAPGGRRPGGGRPGGPGAGGPGAGGPGAGGPGAGGGRPPGGAPGGGAQGGGGGARGMSAMFAGQGPAEPDLTEAWSPEGNLEFPFADFRHRLHTGNYLSSLLTRQADSVESASGSHPLSPWLPTIIFVLAGFTAFATGSSWGTMGIVMPLAIPLAMSMLTGSETDIASSSIFLATIGSVLAGAVFGDHCSPISDTTVLSSQASGCDHLAHVWTQMPYALTVGLITILFGTIPVGFGFPWQLCLVLGTVALVVVALFMGRTVDSVISGEDERSTDTAAPSGSTQTESN